MEDQELMAEVFEELGYKNEILFFLQPQSSNT